MCMVFFILLMHKFRSNAITLKWLGAVLPRRLTRSRLEDHVTLAISLRGQVAALGEDRSLKRQLVEMRTGMSCEKRKNGGVKGNSSSRFEESGQSKKT